LCLCTANTWIGMSFQSGSLKTIVLVNGHWSIGDHAGAIWKEEYWNWYRGLWCGIQSDCSSSRMQFDFPYWGGISPNLILDNWWNLVLTFMLSVWIR
jgi:hypothetical protein